MNTGKSLTFFGLFGVVDSIEIPILQRDYAQGREEAADVRSLFLSSLFDALTVSDGSPYQVLDLDFVYGNFERKDNKVFSVLDGQQRLTTLFLLHWYLAVKHERLVDFRERFVTCDGISRFSYKTRPSTTEFFNALTSPNFEPKYDSISKQINDSQWFYSSWKQDPTVQSCLCMLDAIEDMFGSYDDDLYKRLINTATPFITFQFLNLHSFGLSDELYIKMNARGKPLTAFENFKAWLFGKVDNLSLDSNFEHKIDQQWTDIFWQLSIKENTEFDKLYLRFFNLLAFYHSCEITEGSYSLLSKDEKVWLTNIRAASDYVPHSQLEQIKAFEQKDINRVTKILDYVITSDHNEQLKLFQSAVTTTGYLSQIRFYAFILFIEKAPQIDDWNEETHTQLSRWLRVTTNLINNHRIDELASFIPSVRALHQLSEYCLDFYESIIQDSFKTTGFTKEQWKEERVKAKLILNDKSWDPLLIKYEHHSYLKGKVGFILQMACVDENYQQELFKSYAIKVGILLSSEVLTSPKFLLQRSLLSIGDYLILDGYNRYSFGLSNFSTYRERSENWLSVVTKPVFKTLLDRITGNNKPNVLLELQGIVDADTSEGWRSLIVKYPEAIKYCSNRLIYRRDQVVYLLTKSTRRGYHSELRTYALDIELSALKNINLLPEAISSTRYNEVYGEELPPHLWVNFTDGVEVSLSFNKNGFFALDVVDEEGTGVTVEIPDVLREQISKLFPGEKIA